MDRKEFDRLWRLEQGKNWKESIGLKISTNASTLFKNSFKRIKGHDFIADTDSDIDCWCKYTRMYQNILIDNLEDYTEESYQKLLKTLIIRRKLRDIDLEFK